MKHHVLKWMLNIAYSLTQFNWVFPMPLQLEDTHTHTQPFYSPFSETTQLSQCQNKSSSGLCAAREDNRGRHTDHELEDNWCKICIWLDALPDANQGVYHSLDRSLLFPLESSRGKRHQSFFYAVSLSP